MAYYDQIAKQWHTGTGYEGGAFKRFVLNEVLIGMIPDVLDRSILELGAGNGYFVRLVLRRFSGRHPSRIVITDQSNRLLEIARRHLRVTDAEYQPLDVGDAFPFPDKSFDLIIASMLFNEIPRRIFKNALKECNRVLSDRGLFLMAVTHPSFVNSLRKRGLLTHAQGEIFVMPGSGSLRLPVVIRSKEAYERQLTESGFHFKGEEIFPTTEVLNAKSGLKNTGKVPLALVYQCEPELVSNPG